jgi:hypothetical protein
MKRELSFWWKYAHAQGRQLKGRPTLQLRMVVKALTRHDGEFYAALEVGIRWKATHWNFQ